MPPTPPITWPIAVLLLIVVAGITFLGYEHDVDQALVSEVYTAVVAGALVGHFASKGSGGGSP